jgi:hypothetical protein
MKRACFVATLCLALSGCLAGNMARDLSLKGKPLGAVEQRYGQLASKEPVQGGSRYTWAASDAQHPCTLLVTTDTTERVTDVKMVGGNRDCFRFGSMTAGKR